MFVRTVLDRKASMSRNDHPLPKNTSFQNVITPCHKTQALQFCKVRARRGDPTRRPSTVSVRQCNSFGNYSLDNIALLILSYMLLQGLEIPKFVTGIRVAIGQINLIGQIHLEDLE